MATSSNGNGNSSNGNGNGKRYFNLHTTGLGYLNRIREKPGRRGFLACDISALRGASDDVEYSRFDVIVSGSDAQHLIRKCDKAVKANRKVLLGFRLGDVRLEQFTYPADYRIPEKAGQPGASLKARLLFISWIKIDQEVVYKAKPHEQEQHSTATDEPPESEPASSDADSSDTGNDNAGPPPTSETTATQAAA
jgi:Protein of unknown function (DUF3577)